MQLHGASNPASATMPFFQRAQHKARFAVAYALDFVEAFARQALVILGIFDCNAQQVIVFARHQPSLYRLGYGGQRFAKFL